MLMQHATAVKTETTGVEISSGKNIRRPFFWDLRSVSFLISHQPWFALNKKQWEVEHVNSDLPQFEFPDKDLLDHLVSLYFERLNLYAPLLHRPTFERDLANDLHLHDTGFGQVVLMVCALASRCTNDPRVTLPNDKTGLSSGFKFFRQTRLMRNKILDRASLYDLQYFCVSDDFLLPYEEMNVQLVGNPIPISILPSSSWLESGGTGPEICTGAWSTSAPG